jgi:hypothetical protein
MSYGIHTARLAAFSDLGLQLSAATISWRDFEMNSPDHDGPT